MVRRLATTVASSGTSSVARKTRKTTFLPGKSSIANVYPAMTELTT